MTRRDNHGRFAAPVPTIPLLVRKPVTARSKGVAQGNRTRASNRRQHCLAIIRAALASRP